jgi:hypothetical protein
LDSEEESHKEDSMSYEPPELALPQYAIPALRAQRIAAPGDFARALTQFRRRGFLRELPGHAAEKFDKDFLQGLKPNYHSDLTPGLKPRPPKETTFRHG